MGKKDDILFISNRLKFNYKPVNYDEVENLISYSKFSKFLECPRRWKLAVVDKLEPFEDNIYTVFGSAMHEVVQSWLITMYNESAKEANKMDLRGMLLERLTALYKEAVEKNGGAHFSDREELRRFYFQGCSVIEFLKKKRSDYFKLRGWELAGIEVPIWIHPDKERREDLKFLGYIDVVLYDKKYDTYHLIDLKTSKAGWNKWKKKDKKKTDQLVLYKKFFAEQYSIDPKKIQVEFFIMKNTIDENSVFPQNHVQKFSPSNGSVSVNRAAKKLDEFIEFCFDEDSKIKADKEYPAVTGERGWNCTFCTFKDDEVNCPKAKRVPCL